MLASPALLSSCRAGRHRRAPSPGAPPAATGSRPGGTGSGAAMLLGRRIGGAAREREGRRCGCGGPAGAGSCGRCGGGAAAQAAGLARFLLDVDLTDCLRGEAQLSIELASAVSRSGTTDVASCSARVRLRQASRRLRAPRAAATGVAGAAARGWQAARGLFRCGGRGRLGRAAGAAPREQCLDARDHRARRRDAPAVRDRLAHARQLVETGLDDIERGVVGGDACRSRPGCTSVSSSWLRSPMA